MVRKWSMVPISLSYTTPLLHVSPQGDVDALDDGATEVVASEEEAVAEAAVAPVAAVARVAAVADQAAPMHEDAAVGAAAEPPTAAVAEPMDVEQAPVAAVRAEATAMLVEQVAHKAEAEAKIDKGAMDADDNEAGAAQLEASYRTCKPLVRRLPRNPKSSTAEWFCFREVERVRGGWGDVRSCDRRAVLLPAGTPFGIELESTELGHGVLFRSRVALPTTHKDIYHAGSRQQ
jgi:hypothetical protein